MKALLYSDWGKIELAQLPVPKPAKGEVLIKVSACGICGSELETFRNKIKRRKPPIVMGHEFSGVIESVGEGVENWEKGRRVVSHALVHCGACKFCKKGLTNLCVNRTLFGMHRQGAFAEFVTVPENILVEIPENVSMVNAALSEPLANGINVMSMGPSAEKKRVFIIGAGPMGLMCLQAAKALKNSSVVISDFVNNRLKVASKLGAYMTINPRYNNLLSEINTLWKGEKPDFIIDAVGSQITKRQSLELLEPGGTAVWLGLHNNAITFDSYVLPLEQKSVTGSYSGSFSDIKKAIALFAAGKADGESWVNVYPLEDGVEAFYSVLENQNDNIKAVITFS